jgi:hypothetical protein
MRRHAWKFLAIALVLVLCVPFVAAQMPMAGQMQRRGPMMGAGMPNYDTATEVTLKGTVEAVKQIQGMQGRQGMGGTHLTIKTEKESIDVHVGPSWFLQQHKMTFSKGDQLEVTGSRVKFENADALLAREIKKGEQTLTLRNAQGVPAWAGMGMGRKRGS